MGSSKTALTVKKSKLTAFWGWEVQTQKITITMIFILSYKRMS